MPHKNFPDLESERSSSDIVLQSNVSRLIIMKLHSFMFVWMRLYEQLTVTGQPLVYEG